MMPTKSILCFLAPHIQDLGINYTGASNCLHNVTRLNPVQSLLTKCGYTPLRYAIMGPQKEVPH